jgi:hypothetical protein
MFEKPPNSDRPEEKIELLKTGIEMPKKEYEKYKGMAIDFLNHRTVSDLDELSNGERVKLGEVVLQMASGLEKFADIIEQSRSTAKE